jgi:hypothetical protein
MAADISLNGQPLGHATNQFNRYIFSSTSNVHTFFFKCIPHSTLHPSHVLLSGASFDHRQQHA